MAQKDDIGEVLSAQAERTPAEISCAQADACLSVFRFAGAMGSGFKPDKLPRTIALINRVVSIADKDVAYAKMTLKRPRPFVTDHRVKKIVRQCPDFCYPSRHSTFAFAVAILLGNMVPEKKSDIFARADRYAHNRVVAGVHYPSDIEAGRISASVIDYTLMRDPQFQDQYKRARSEVVSACWWKKQKASSSSEFSKRLALAGRRVKEDDAHEKGYQEGS